MVCQQKILITNLSKLIIQFLSDIYILNTLFSSIGSQFSNVLQSLTCSTEGGLEKKQNKIEQSFLRMSLGGN